MQIADPKQGKIRQCTQEDIMVYEKRLAKLQHRFQKKKIMLDRIVDLMLPFFWVLVTSMVSVAYLSQGVRSSVGFSEFG